MLFPSCFQAALATLHINRTPCLQGRHGNYIRWLHPLVWAMHVQRLLYAINYCALRVVFWLLGTRIELQRLLVDDTPQYMYPWQFLCILISIAPALGVLWATRGDGGVTPPVAITALSTVTVFTQLGQLCKVIADMCKDGGILRSKHAWLNALMLEEQVRYYFDKGEIDFKKWAAAA